MHSSTSAGAAGQPTEGEALLQTVEVSTGANPDFSVIWLHGLGADGHDFEPVVPMLGLPAGASLRFVFPHAPVRPVTLNGGMPMRAWYDIRNLTDGRDQDEAGVEASARAVRALMAREVERGVPVSRQIVAGFSQGGAMALHVALRYPERLAGLIALSSYLLFADRLGEEASEANRDLPTFIAHGTQDPVVAYDFGARSARRLESLGYPVEWRSYPMPHSVSPAELVDIGRFITARLG
ncbi:MAG: alpha/beta fold hydrolase [Xanthomonadales bacterium]|jgi:phospholipase/carboxylesterase|nr:alpha/beta fold hydrolase [Xanthomonadales bacterium]